ncbi:MAG: ferrous iron transport protein A [Phycisphaerales bacterium]|nr:ferrous iron transport protein A [Phycisphaerales bacterium]
MKRKMTTRATERPTESESAIRPKSTNERLLVRVDCETESQYHPPMASKGIQIPLSQLVRGQRATVECSALDALPADHRCLLAAMGMGEKCEVRVCRAGTPCIVQIDRTRLGLPRDVAERILVTLLESPRP